MKKSVFVVFFCILFFVGQVSAQKNWTPIYIPRVPSFLSYSYVDYSTMRRLPNGNITFWHKDATGEIYQVEVDCVGKQERTLKMMPRVRTDSYGNKIGGGEEGAINMQWRAITPDSIGETVDSTVCRSAKTVAPQSDKPVAEKKAVTKTRKRTPKRKQ
jgi:hypothetical protein